ncbi:PEP/pyruvate-binding domain-containing protein [Planctomycetota bacterium]
MKNTFFMIFIAIVLNSTVAMAQENVPITNYSVNDKGQIEIQFESSSNVYYVLYARHTVNGAEFPVSMVLGEDGTTTLSEQLGAYPIEHYRVNRYSKTNPADHDDDGIDDIQEFQNLTRLGPFNPADEINFFNGAVTIPDRATFKELSYNGAQVFIDTHLADLEFVKFYINEFQRDHPKVYFMNTKTHRAHMSFAQAVGFNGSGGGGGRGRTGRSGGSSGQLRGEIVYHPHVIGPSGKAGVYRFEFEPTDSHPFATVQRAYELLALNMPFLQNNLTYYPMPRAALPRYNNEKNLYDASRVAILLEEDIFKNVSYLPLNMAEGYGLLKIMELEGRPNSRDIVIYEALPNELSRIGGIITTVPQTALSHVNLRAIQDNVPNAYIAEALRTESISALIGKYVHYQVNEKDFIIEEATFNQVEEFYKDIRPAESQTPERDISITKITPLDNIAFDQWDSFGVKTANLATLRTLGFPEGTVPNGFGIPFYFYDEFMKYNRLYDYVEKMLTNQEFLEDYQVQEDMLTELRDAINNGGMPGWMMQELTEMQNSFPEGTSIRLRSSTNNEDLPGFSGAGLYDSDTHKPDEGHISTTVKHIFASLWTFRAFDERQFYRIDHLSTAMGILCHPNFSLEKANGVGVSTDPFYQTVNTYYLNTQIGEDLVTNPNSLSVPEEILLSSRGYTIMRPSNQKLSENAIMSDRHLADLRSYLQIIHNEFRALYDIVASEQFAMEIEYKVTADDKLAIKQARPWIFTEGINTNTNTARTNFRAGNMGGRGGNMGGRTGRGNMSGRGGRRR